MKCNPTIDTRLGSICPTDGIVGGLFCGEPTIVTDRRRLDRVVWHQTSTVKFKKSSTDESHQTFTYNLFDEAPGIDIVLEEFVEMHLPRIQLTPTPASIPLDHIYVYTSVASDQLTTGKTYLINAPSAQLPNLVTNLNLASLPVEASVFSPRHRARWGQYVGQTILRRAERRIDDLPNVEIDRYTNFALINTKMRPDAVKQALIGMSAGDESVLAPVGTGTSYIPEARVTVPLMFQNIDMSVSAKDPSVFINENGFHAFRYRCPKLVIKFMKDIRRALFMEEEAAVDLSANKLGFIVYSEGSAPSDSDLFNVVPGVSSVTPTGSIWEPIGIGSNFYRSDDTIVMYNNITSKNPTVGDIGLRYLAPSGGWRPITRPTQNANFISDVVDYAKWFNLNGTPYFDFNVVVRGLKYPDHTKHIQMRDSSTSFAPLETYERYTANREDRVRIEVDAHSIYIKYILAMAVNDIARRQGNYFVFRNDAEPIVSDDSVNASSIVGNIDVYIDDQEDQSNSVNIIKHNINPMFLNHAPDMNIFTAATWTDYQIRYQGNTGFFKNSCDKLTVRYKLAEGSYKSMVIAVLMSVDNDYSRTAQI